MRNTSIVQWSRLAWWSFVVLTLIVCVGCKKKEPPEPVAATPVVETPAAPVPEPAAAPVYAEPAPVEDTQANIAQVDARVQNQDYEGAVDVILRAQIAAQQQEAMSTPQQRVSYYNRMRMLQKQIADAVASGDPSAQRAAQLLMQYNAARTQGR